MNKEEILKDIKKAVSCNGDIKPYMFNMYEITYVENEENITLYIPKRYEYLFWLEYEKQQESK